MSSSSFWKIGIGALRSYLYPPGVGLANTLGYTLCLSAHLFSVQEYTTKSINCFRLSKYFVFESLDWRFKEACWYSDPNICNLQRGWTTWTTAAVDSKRVKCITPIVLDVLNMVKVSGPNSGLPANFFDLYLEDIMVADFFLLPYTST